MATSPLIDSDMVDEVTKLGFDREEVIQSVKHRQQNKVWLKHVLQGSQQQKAAVLVRGPSADMQYAPAHQLHCARHH